MTPNVLGGIEHAAEAVAHKVEADLGERTPAAPAAQASSELSLYDITSMVKYGVASSGLANIGLVASNAQMTLKTYRQQDTGAGVKLSVFGVAGAAGAQHQSDNANAICIEFDPMMENQSG